MRHDLIDRVILSTLGVIPTVPLPYRGQDDAELPPDVTARPSRTIPIMYTTTAGGKPIITEREYRRITSYVADPVGKVSLGTAAEPLGMNIRGRGHSSWKGDRKPYKLKPGEKLPFMGMPKNKHWVLLRFWPPTMAGMELGQLMGMAQTPSTKPTEVVLNGNYIGLYLLAETIRVGKNRASTYEQPDNNGDVATIPGDWLIEMDNYKEQNQISFRENGRQIINITYHLPRVFSTAQKNWLTAEFKRLDDDIYTPSKATSRWKDHIDVDTMACFSIIQEVMDSPDGFHGSFYLHKDQGEGSKWVTGPIWDLTYMSREKTDYTFRMKASYVFAPHWIEKLFKDGDSSSAICKAWRGEHPVLSDERMHHLESCFVPHEEAYERDKQRWTKGDSKSLHNATEELTTVFWRSVDWLNRHSPATPSAITLIMPTVGYHIIYTMSGEVVRIVDDCSETMRDLPQGIYIVDNSKVIVP